MRLAANADVGFIRGVDQAYYRVHEQNMRKAVSALMDLRQRRLVFEMVLDRYGERLPDAKRLSDLVHRQLAERRSGLPDVCTTGDACGRLSSAGASWVREQTRRRNGTSTNS